MENLIIESKSGSSLHALLYKTNNIENSKCLIMCHGFTGDKTEWGRFPKMANACSDIGLDTLVFDFTGSGENERVPITLSKQFKDLESIYQWVKENGYSEIAVLGLSFGGLTALGANLPDIKCYVFWAPFFFLHTTNDQTDWFSDIKNGPVEIPSSGNVDPVIIDMSFMTDFAKFRVKSALKKLNRPTLIVQGKADNKVPYEFTRKAFRLIPENNKNRLVEIEGANHDFDGPYLQKFIENTINFLKNNL